MITSIRLVNFKNFADETLRVGPFTVIVGANASGKSNIRDAFRFLHGVGRGYSLAEIIGGRYGTSGQREWEPLRGAANEIIRFGQSAFTLEITLELTALEWSVKELHYSIEVGWDEETGKFNVRKEELRDEATVIYTASPPEKLPGPLVADVHWAPDLQGDHYVEGGQPALTALRLLGQSGGREKLRSYQGIDILCAVLARMRFLDLSPERMREPAFPGATVLGDSGENLSTVIEEICSIPKRQKILAGWMETLTPMDVTGFDFPRDPSGRVHLVILEKNNQRVSAYSASDGTLRFLAMLAVLILGRGDVNLYFVEEVDTGIHPVRLGLMLDLFEGPIRGNGQVIGTTHAPTLLTAMNDDTFETTSVVCRLEDRADAIIRPVAGLPNVQELRRDQGLGRLHESGWMEDALSFTEDYDETENGS